MSFHQELKIKIHKFVKDVYGVSKKFPRDELYGITSQLRRAVISIILNYIEGYARRRGNECKVFKNFIEISYGSLKESEYLIYFSYTEGYIDKVEYGQLSKQASEIGGMIFGILKNIKS